MILKKLLVSTVLVMISAVGAVAEQNIKPLPVLFSENKPPEFSIVHTANEVVVNYNDGRVAALEMRELPPLSFDVSMKVDETTCSEIKAQKCSLKVNIIGADLAFHWIKNPAHKNRIGKDVLPVGDGGSPMVDFSEYWRSEFQKIYPEKARKVEADELTCDDFSFLPGGADTKTSPETLTVVDWGNEIMSVNSETKVNENRVTSGAMNVQFEKSGERSMKIKDIGIVMSQDSSVPTLFVGDIIGWTVRQPNGKEFCQVSFKADADATIATVLRKIKEMQDKTKFKLYAPEQDPELWHQFQNSNSDGSGLKVTDVKNSYWLGNLLGILTLSKVNGSDGKDSIMITPQQVQ